MIPKNLSHCYKGSEPHVRLLSLGIQQRDWESPGNLTLKEMGSDYRISTELGKTVSILGGVHKQSIVCTKTQGKRAVTHRRLNQTYLWLLKGLLWRHGSAVAHSGDGHPGSISPGPLTPTIDPTDPRAWSPQAKQLTWKEHNPTHHR